MNGVTTSAYWDDLNDVRHARGATITATPLRMAYLKYVNLVKEVTGTAEELSDYQTELDRLQGRGTATGDSPVQDETALFSI